MTDNIRWGLDNPHPFSQMKTELIWEGKCDEYGNRRIMKLGSNEGDLVADFFCGSGTKGAGI